MPRWVAGTSIGAINAAIIAGNPAERRVPRLREFWERVSSRLLGWPLAEDGNSRRIFNETSAVFSAAAGVPGFFEPRIPPAVIMPQGTPEAISVYDTEPLKVTLSELVDFDLLNSGAVRLSIGAVEVLTGNMQYLTPIHKLLALSTSWRAGVCLQASLPSRLRVSPIGMEGWFPTRPSSTS
jgi:NTE family protein